LDKLDRLDIPDRLDILDYRAIQVLLAHKESLGMRQIQEQLVLLGYREQLDSLEKLVQWVIQGLQVLKEFRVMQQILVQPEK
jgi:hypothetical protein